jgi:hypothetical protein
MRIPSLAVAVTLIALSTSLIGQDNSSNGKSWTAPTTIRTGHPSHPSTARRIRLHSSRKPAESRELQQLENQTFRTAGAGAKRGSAPSGLPKTAREARTPAMNFRYQAPKNTTSRTGTRRTGARTSGGNASRGSYNH